MRVWSSLRGRITLVTIGVAVVAVLVTALIVLPLVRSVAQEQARAEVTRQAETLSRSPAITGRLEARERRLLGSDGSRTAVVDPSGNVVGSAQGYLDDGMVARLLGGDDVSATVDSDDGPVLVEARPLRRGGAVAVAQPLEAVDEAANALLLRVLLALAVGLLVSGVAGVLLARRLARPLTETAGVARRLASGERSVPIARPGVAEVDDVANALGALDHALTTSEGRQREFLLSISHEIRTPLTAVQGYAEAMADGLVPPESLSEVGATLLAESRRLERFVSDLLVLARLEADDFVLHPQTVDLVTLVDDVCRAWVGQAHRLDVELRPQQPPHPMVVTTDPMRARQVVDGLVENALRASPAGGVVVVALSPDQDEATIAVRDAGPGLAADDVAVAFERGVLHYRYRDTRKVGTGLGLSIASRLVERLGGSITVATAPEGGASFTVRLPRAPTPPLSVTLWR